MGWMTYAGLSIFFYSIFDLFIKLSSDKVNIWLNAFLGNFIASILIFLFMMYLYFHGEKLFLMKPGGVLYTLLAGLAITGAGICFLKMFSMGTNLSVGVPLVRIGMVILGSLLGVLILKEGITLRYGIGFGLSLAGLYLIMTAK